MQHPERPPILTALAAPLQHSPERPERTQPRERLHLGCIDAQHHKADGDHKHIPPIPTTASREERGGSGGRLKRAGVWAC